MNKIILTIFGVVGVLVLVIALGLVMAFPVKWCWNVTMPYIFSLPAISWGQAWCLSFLATVFFKPIPTKQF